MARQANYNANWTCANDSKPSIHYCRNPNSTITNNSCFINMRFEKIVVKVDSISHVININSTAVPHPDKISCDNVTIGK